MLVLHMRKKLGFRLSYQVMCYIECDDARPLSRATGTSVGVILRPNVSFGNAKRKS